MEERPLASRTICGRGAHSLSLRASTLAGHEHKNTLGEGPYARIIEAITTSVMEGEIPTVSQKQISV